MESKGKSYLNRNPLAAFCPLGASILTKQAKRMAVGEYYGDLSWSWHRDHCAVCSYVEHAYEEIVNPTVSYKRLKDKNKSTS
jgi:hypothetical protein